MNDRMTYDPLLVALARYALGPEVGGEEAFRNARMSFADAVGCALRALELPAKKEKERISKKGRK
jgi:2-methylcitrate dehydratase PrpD